MAKETVKEVNNQPWTEIKKLSAIRVYKEYKKTKPQGTTQLKQ